MLLFDQASDLAMSRQTSTTIKHMKGHLTAWSHRRISSSVQSAGSAELAINCLAVETLAPFWIRFGRKHLIAPDRPCRRRRYHTCEAWGY